MAGMTLLVVRCPACGTTLIPGDDDLVVACLQCGAALQLADEGLRPIEIQYAQTNRTKAGTWRPWWIFKGSVNLIKRETQGGNRSDEARETLSHFIREAHRQGIRCVRVVHGKGHGSPGREPVLKTKVRGWLVQKQEVLAFVQARPAEGGSGALVVLLKATN